MSLLRDDNIMLKKVYSKDLDFTVTSFNRVKCSAMRKYSGPSHHTNDFHEFPQNSTDFAKCDGATLSCPLA